MIDSSPTGCGPKSMSVSWIEQNPGYEQTADYCVQAPSWNTWRNVRLAVATAWMLPAFNGSRSQNKVLIKTGSGQQTSSIEQGFGRSKSRTILRRGESIRQSNKKVGELIASAYLVRHELNAMHNPGAPQIYPVCFQARVTSAGTGVPSETVTFPNAYADFSQDFREIDVWKEQKSDNAIVYTPPGPRVATFGTAQNTPDSSAAPINNASTSGTLKVDSQLAPSSAPIISDIVAPDTVPAAVTESTLLRSASSLQSKPPAPSQTGSTIQPSSNRTHRGGRGSHRTRRACGA